MSNLNPEQFSSWNAPIEMLYTCHGKVKQFCRQLQILPDYLEQHGCNQAVQNDVRQILTYFNQAAPLHHDDEELDFFPALIQAYPESQQRVEQLAEQHLSLHQTWDELALVLEKLLTGEVQQIDKALIARFVEGYEQHITLEEPLFELGREYLSETTLQAIGSVMENRRKV